MCKKRIRLDVDRGFSKDFRLNKRAQITIFIILGILMLLALIIIVGLKKEIITFKPEELLPTEKGKVENYLTACINKLGTDALYKIGAQAGYLEVPKNILQTNSLHLKISSMIVVPYWAYGPKTNIPPLQDIKLSIDKYIEDNLKQCLFDFEPFQETYDLIEKSPITANTEIVENKVIFNVHWDLLIKNKAGEVITEVMDHVSESPIRFKQVYDTAVRIIEAEMSDLKLEDLTQDLIALEHPDLPMTGFEISCTPKTWNPKTAKETLQNMLRINLKQLKVKGTDFVEFPEELPYYQNHYVWDIGEDFKKSEIGVVFNYENSFPFAFGVTPLSGNKMKSSSLGGNQLLSFLCLKNWKFTYDVVYPVLVRVSDEKNNYEFNIAFTVHLIRNTPNRNKEVESKPSYYYDTISDDDFCKVRDVPMTAKTYELVENNLGVSNREDLGDVNLTFTCLKYGCHVGQTEYDYGGMGFAGLITKYPYCVGGILRGSKDNYKDDWERVVTSPGKEVELSLVPLAKFPADKIKIIKHQITDLDDPKNLGPGVEMKEKEMADLKIKFDKTISITELKIPEADEFTGLVTSFHESSLVFSKEIDPKILKEENLEFLAKADFNYGLEIMVFKTDGEEGSFIGGYKGQWNPSWEKLKNAQSITFHVVTNSNFDDEEKALMLFSLENVSLYLPAPEIK